MSAMGTYIPYTMADVRDVPKDGPTLLSMFSGVGGSCVGFELAGFRLLGATEFLPEVAEVYRFNHPGVPVIEKDIRQLTGLAMLEELGLEPGSVDVMEGSPPCASFSTMTTGRGRKYWGGKTHKYDTTMQATDDLFQHYIRLVGEIRPKVAVAENVKGLIEGPKRGYFLEIKRGFESIGYRFSSMLLDASDFGVPQERHRVLMAATRGLDGPMARIRATTRDKADKVTIADAWRNLDHAGDRWPKVMRLCMRDQMLYGGSAITSRSVALERVFGRNKYFSHQRLRWDQPCPCVTTIDVLFHPDERRRLTINELKRVFGYPDDFRLEGTHHFCRIRLARSVPPFLMRALALAIREILE